jgi:hypothetical protein
MYAESISPIKLLLKSEKYLGKVNGGARKEFTNPTLVVTELLAELFGAC